MTTPPLVQPRPARQQARFLRRLVLGARQALASGPDTVPAPLKVKARADGARSGRPHERRAAPPAFPPKLKELEVDYGAYHAGARPDGATR